MTAWYPTIKTLHANAVMMSGTFFALRALALLAGMRWPRAALVRYASYSIDTVLLAAALALVGLLPAAIFSNGWLWVKLSFVFAYISLGIAAFRLQKHALIRALLVLAACACFVQAYAIARSHHPSGLGVWFVALVA